jgi:hypothetical protein
MFRCGRGIADITGEPADTGIRRRCIAGGIIDQSPVRKPGTVSTGTGPDRASTAGTGGPTAWT